MSVNETIMANKLRRSKTLSLLLVVLFTLSTMSLPACSDNDNNTASQRVVKAMVSCGDEGPVAMAWVQDGAQNFVSDAILSINDRPFELTFLDEEESDEDSVPTYYLDLHDLKGGDLLTLVAKRSDGTLIYTSPLAQIPMPIELVEPLPDQPIIPGEEVVVRWTGGEGCSHIAAIYADDLGEEQYMDVQKYGDVEFISVPPGVIREGGAVIGAAALSGDHPLLRSDPSDDPLASSFLVHSEDAIVIQAYDVNSINGSIVGLPLIPNIPPHDCPSSPMSRAAANAVCVTEFITPPWALALVWSIRQHMDATCCSPCRLVPLDYCRFYSVKYDHLHWARGCLCPWNQ